MQNTGLLFIPDISGFTRFVKEVEIEHSRLIIQELLEILIDSNELGLVVSEIEGDAILFYKFGDKPGLNAVYHQVEKMFTAFHKTLLAYERRKYCQCNACLSAVNLTLKIVTHYGEFTEYNVKSFNKLIGKDVIVAHQLLKNDITKHEYWIVTPELLKDGSIDADGRLRWNSGQKATESGDVYFQYAHLGFLKDDIIVDQPHRPNLTNFKKVLSLTREFDTDTITLLHAAADFSHRNKWMEGVKDVEIQNHFLPRIGNRTIIILENGKTSITANYYTFSENVIEFSEVNEFSGDISFYTVEKIEDCKSRLIFDYYTNASPFSLIMFGWGRGRGLKARMEKSFENLSGYLIQVGDSVRAKTQPMNNAL